MARRLNETENFLSVVHQLRKRCPWDKKQTHRTLARYLIEEAYEVVAAIEAGDESGLCEELGAVLLQVALHAEIANEKKKFSFESVSEQIADKMVRRHPHVFKGKKALNYKEHLKNWTLTKAKEKPKKSLLAGIPLALPSLQMAQRYGEIAGSVGFDWDSSREVMQKVDEELKELKSASAKTQEEEIGDLLFTLAQLCRHLKLDAEAVLRKSNKKFASRFEGTVKKARKKKADLTQLKPSEWDALWQSLKEGKRYSSRETAS